MRVGVLGSRDDWDLVRLCRPQMRLRDSDKV